MPYLTGQVLSEADIAALFASGTYTPTLVGMVIGTGGTPINTAKWTFVGFPAGGILTVEGKIKFGTAGQTFPAATITASLPAGYAQINFADQYSHLVAAVTYTDVSPESTYQGCIRPASSTTVRFVTSIVSGTNIAHGGTGTTQPFTWASNDEIYYRFSARCTGP